MDSVSILFFFCNGIALLRTSFFSLYIVILVILILIVQNNVDLILLGNNASFLTKQIRHL